MPQNVFFSLSLFVGYFVVSISYAFFNYVSNMPPYSSFNGAFLYMSVRLSCKLKWKCMCVKNTRSVIFCIVTCVISWICLKTTKAV